MVYRAENRSRRSRMTRYRPDMRESRNDLLREVTVTFNELEAWGASHGWAGADPYDGLNATRFVNTLRRTASGRQLLTQVVKRSPLNVRPLLGIPAGRSPVTIALALSAYAISPTPDVRTRRIRMLELARQLDAERCEEAEFACWGYHFDVQTRVFFYPSGSPNTIASAFAGLAFVHAHDAEPSDVPLEPARRTAEYFLRRVPQTAAGQSGGAYFGYLNGDTTPIHNASMLVSSLLACVGTRTHDRRYLDAAERGVQYTVQRQRPNGSWPYGERPGLHWIDNFHTGYVIEALLTCEANGIPIPEGVIHRALAFYQSQLFLPDGTPKYYSHAQYPIDALSVAQGIQTFSLAAASYPGAYEFALQIFGFYRRRMRRPDGAPIFQRRRFWANKTVHPRWTVAPMLLALAHLQRVGTES